MLQLRASLLLILCVALPAQAGLFTDDEAHKQIDKLEARVLQLEALNVADVTKQQTKSLLDLQGQLDDIKNQLRNLRGQNEEIAHGLQDAEKREKDFYVDLDTRLRKFESANPNPDASVASTASADPSDPAVENRAIEAAYANVTAGNNANAVKAFQDFLKKYPDSVHVPNALFWLAGAQAGTKDHKGALVTLERLLNDYPKFAKGADATLLLANSQIQLKQTAAAQKTLKQLIAKYPDSAAAEKARKLAAASK
jgi:tol-pal system protein YbgF